MSYYEDLGVPREASAAEIKKAHRRMASKWHPDRKGGQHEMFQLIQRAYETLSDEKKRAYYDQHGQDERAGPTLRQRAIQTIAMIFGRLVSTGKIDVDHENVIERLRIATINGQTQLPEKMKEMRGILAKFERARRRLRAKKGKHGELTLMLDAQIKGLKEGLENLEQEKLVGDEMLKILAEYSYDADPHTSTTPYTTLAQILGSGR